MGPEVNAAEETLRDHGKERSYAFHGREGGPGEEETAELFLRLSGKLSDRLVTVVPNLRYQQNITGRRIDFIIFLQSFLNRREYPGNTSQRCVLAREQKKARLEMVQSGGSRGQNFMSLTGDCASGNS